MSDMKLFFKGVVAKLIQLLGWVGVFFSFAFMSVSGWLFMLVLLIGVGLIIFGKAKHFTYRREAGYIVYKS